jgi:lysophospholipase L1-like esterase
MYPVIYRLICIAAAAALAVACAATPTGPTAATAGEGPLISQGPLTGLIPQGPPPVPPQLVASPVTALSATGYVAFGDSITYGTLSSYDGSFLYDVPSQSYPVRLKLALDSYHPGAAGQTPRTYSVANAGNPGEWATDGARRIQSVLTANRPQGLLLLEGINDLSNDQSISSTISALGRIIDTARSNNVTVLVATLPQTYETTNPISEQYHDNARDLVVPFNTQLRQAFGTRQNVYIVDLYAALGTNHTYIGADGLHPNEAGYERIAQWFEAAIATVFAIKGSFQ